jgi:hypothetical protein
LINAKRVVNLSIGQVAGRGGQCSPVDAVEKEGIGVNRKTREVALLLIVAEEEEELVLDDRTADRATKLVTDVVRLDTDALRRAILQNRLE